MIAVPLLKSVVLPLALVVRVVGHLLLRLQRRLMSPMVKHRKRNDQDSKGIKDLDVHVDVEVEDAEVEDTVVKGAPVVDNKVAEEALVDVGVKKGEDEDVVDVALHVKLQVDKTSMLLIEPVLRCNFLALYASVAFAI